MVHFSAANWLGTAHYRGKPERPRIPFLRGPLSRAKRTKPGGDSGNGGRKKGRTSKGADTATCRKLRGRRPSSTLWLTPSFAFGRLRRFLWALERSDLSGRLFVPLRI